MASDIFKDYETLQNICKCILNLMGLHSSSHRAQLAYPVSISEPS